MIKIYNLTDDSMKKVLSLHTRSEDHYEDAYWDYPIEEIDELVSRSTDKGVFGLPYTYNNFAFCDGRLYEIPEDIIDELEEL